MSKAAVRIEIAGAPAEELLRAVFLGPFAGHVAPAYVVKDDPRESAALLDVERYEPELYATVYAGPSIVSAVAQLSRGSAGREIKVWCAVRAGFPVDGVPMPASYLRFGVPEMYIPLAVLVVGEDRITLLFEANGAPFLAPERIDDGGPIDQAWARCAEISRAWLMRALSVIRADKMLNVQITGLTS